MRIRTVKPEFHQSATLAQVPREVRLLASALLNWADDEGYFVSIPRVIAGSLFPFDDDGPEFVEQGLKQLERIGFLQLFEGHIGLIPGLPLHQRINRPTKSKLKEKAAKRLNLTEDSLRTHTQLSEGSHPEGKGREGKGKGSGKGAGKGSAQDGLKEKPVQASLEVVPPAQEPKRETRIGRLHAMFLKKRESKLFAPVSVGGLELDEVPPDEAPDWGRSGQALAQWVRLWPDLPEAEVDDRVRHMVLEWLEVSYWARTIDKDGKPCTPYPWGAFITPKQWGPLAKELFGADVSGLGVAA